MRRSTRDLITLSLLIAVSSAPLGCFGKKKRHWSKDPIRPRPVVLGPAPRHFIPDELPKGQPAPIFLTERRGGIRGEARLLPASGALDGPLRGALVEDEKLVVHFVPHEALSAVSVGDGTFFVVASPSGLWLHESRTLAMRGRLAPPSVWEVAASLDGKKLAYATGPDPGLPMRVVVVSWPELAPLAALDSTKPVHRMRFSEDGSRVAIASTRGDAVTLFDIATGKGISIPHNGPSDAQPMPDAPAEVAVAGDDDALSILDVRTKDRGKAYVFHSGVAMNVARQTIYGMARDQRAVLFDPVTNILAGGGDDNRVWRFVDPRGRGTTLDVFELGGNVVDVACCTGSSPSERTAYFAVDDGRVAAVRLQDGEVGPWLSGIDTHGGDWLRIRVALAPDGDVLVTPNKRLARWEPAAGALVASTDYLGRHFTKSGESLEGTMYVGCERHGEPQCHVALAKHEAPSIDTQAESLGTVPLAGAEVVIPLEDGAWAILGNWEKHLRVVPIFPGSPAATPIDVPEAKDFRAACHALRPDGKAAAVADDGGNVWEISLRPPRVTRVGRAAVDVQFKSIEWSASESRWYVTNHMDERGPVTP